MVGLGSRVLQRSNILDLTERAITTLVVRMSDEALTAPPPRGGPWRGSRVLQNRLKEKKKQQHPWSYRESKVVVVVVSFAPPPRRGEPWVKGVAT